MRRPSMTCEMPLRTIASGGRGRAGTGAFAPRLRQVIVPLVTEIKLLRTWRATLTRDAASGLPAPAGAFISRLIRVSPFQLIRPLVTAPFWISSKPVIARSFRFDEAALAHHFIQDRHNIGKVLLVP